MKIIKQNGSFGPNIFIVEDNKCLGFTFGGNGDLYWIIRRNIANEEKYTRDSFIITKENYYLYQLFDVLFSDIENINIFDFEIPYYIESYSDLKKYKKNWDEARKREIKEYQDFNRSNYRELFDRKNNTITWYSDETAQEVANYLKIYKKEETYEVEFNTQPSIEGYDEDFHNNYYIPIRFRNSGSRYDPFNIIFMRMYNNMNDLDDANEVGHQIHIQEYLYNEERKKKLVKSNSANH